MKDRFYRIFVGRINAITLYVFCAYFLIIIGYVFLVSDNIPAPMGYFFWLLLGIRLGYFLANKVGKLNNKTPSS
jgi:hypothetical protein